MNGYWCRNNKQFDCVKMLIFFWLFTSLIVESLSDFPLRQCEPIRIELCQGLGYNETSMPNLVGHELQTDVEFTLQTFVPLIEYVCSSQLKLFLCSAYVPMCTKKVPVPIGPCFGLCEAVRSRCLPILQGFAYPWPPALDCDRFPKQNNHETMCMEGPGEAHLSTSEDFSGTTQTKNLLQHPTLKCPANSHLYIKLHRSERCAPLCDANILFGEEEKHLAEIWVSTWAYAAIGLAVIATVCLLVSDTYFISKWSRMLTPLVWCHNMVTIGWTIRFVSGRTNASCGYDPQLPNDLLLLIDGLSNAPCAATFLLRYYFGMAACAWWAIICLGWHRDIRRENRLGHGNIPLTVSYMSGAQISDRSRNFVNSNKNLSILQNNFARFAAWGFPAFQTAAVIVARLVDADELLGICFVGNQSDKGLEIFVATPLFCYWIFGSMNLISGYLVHRRNKEIIQASFLPSYKHMKSKNCGIGTFVFIYNVPFTFLLLSVIYEFANIDVWLTVSPYISARGSMSTPLWPFLTRAFMELMSGIICFAWVLGPKISTLYKQQMAPRVIQPVVSSSIAQVHPQHPKKSTCVSKEYSTVSYQTVRTSMNFHSNTMALNQISNYSFPKSNYKKKDMQVNNQYFNEKQNQIKIYNGNETIL